MTESYKIARFKFSLYSQRLWHYMFPVQLIFRPRNIRPASPARLLYSPAQRRILIINQIPNRFNISIRHIRTLL